MNMDDKLQLVFDRYDKNKSFKLKIDELPNALKDLNVNCSNDELELIMKCLDIDQTYDLTFDKFKSLFNDAKITSIFNKLDIDKSGTI